MPASLDEDGLYRDQDRRVHHRTHPDPRRVLTLGRSYWNIRGRHFGSDLRLNGHRQPHWPPGQEWLGRERKAL
ncbi:hypothetical protein EYF80_052908 [Liparis tanakae]|uniref:Uncharacterized protein n=1 Tax=Liparis tanakae TaxID=230148 RepID=A0A4Z2F7D7_9TELE|nr:hypothetical protein EYF80_052908 [Liparis tanakae]